MMVSPSSYIEEKKYWKLEKLYKEKNCLEKYISDYKKGKIGYCEKHGIITNPSPDVIASVYEDYLIELNILIKQKENKIEQKYIELTDYEKIDTFLQENDFFDGAEIYKIFNKNGNAEIFIKDGEQEIEFYLYDVTDFTMIYFTDEIYIDSILVNNIDGEISLEIDNNGIYVSAKKIKLKTLDIKNMIYTYASVKYKEEQNKSFYYISNIENLKIGDYVYVPVLETSCPAIVENIETFSYKDVPFPINRTRTIIRKSSKKEYEEYNKKDTNTDEQDYDLCGCDDKFKFEEYSTIKERVKKLPLIKSQNVEWQGFKKNENGSFSMPFPKYEEEIYDWIKTFHDLKLVEHNHVNNFKDIKDKNIQELNFDEILSYLTHIIRGEKFCDGLIASNFENGIIESLEKQLFQFIE